MSRLCERPGCSERGAVAYGFDPDRLLVWLNALDPDADRNRAGVLCLRHADSMVVPLGWTLDDARDVNPRLFRVPREARKPRGAGRRRGAKSGATKAAPEAEQLRLVEQPEAGAEQQDPAPERTVAVVTGVAAAQRDDPDATVAVPWSPDFDVADDLGGVLDAKTPLLGRAFRGTSRRR